MRAIRRHPYLIAAIILAALLVFLAWLFPGSRNIDVTLTATEYRLDDPDYAVEHTVTIQGRDSRNRLGKGAFQGTIAISGLEGMEDATEVLASLDSEYPLTTEAFREPTIPLSVLVPNWDYTEFLALLSNESADGVRSTGGASMRFLVSGPPDRDAALSKAADLAKNTFWADSFQ